jgi:hormone-sensitive lipase
MTDKLKSDEIKFQINATIEGKKYEKIRDLIKLCDENDKFYKNDKSFAGTRMCMAFEKLNEGLVKSEPILREVDSFAHIYDFDESTPGNGYRSFIFIFDAALDYSMKTCQYINDNRGSLLFRKSNYLK